MERLSLVPGSSSCSPGQASDVQQSVPWHTEDEAGAVLGEVGLRLIKPRLHRDSAFLPMQAALHWVGDVHLKVALLTVRREKIGQAGSEWADRELCGFLGNPQGPAICQDPVGWQFQGSTCFLPRGPHRRGRKETEALRCVLRPEGAGKAEGLLNQGTLCAAEPGRQMWLCHC